MPFAVVIHEKGGQPRRQDFDKNEVTIGRVQGNDIVLPKQNVSKKHSRIVVKDGKFIIVDLKSTNGTYVNGRKIASPMVIKETDKIYIGDFILSTEGTGASTNVPEPAPAEPELPKVELPRKAPTPPAPAKLVPTPPKPVAVPGKAVAPSGAATAVSYGSPPSSAPSPKKDNDTVPPIARVRAVTATESAAPSGAVGQLIAYARNEGLALPNRWLPTSEPDQAVVSRLTEFAQNLDDPGIPLPILVAEVTGAGPIQPMIADNAVTAIYVDGPQQIQVESGEATQQLDESFSSADAVVTVAERLINGAGGVWNPKGVNRAQGDGMSISFVLHGSTPHLAIEKFEEEIAPIETLVNEGVLSDPMAEFLLTALALNRSIVVASNQNAVSGRLSKALIEASWQDERVVLIDPSHQLGGFGHFPRLDKSNDIPTLCHHASVLRATHLVFTNVNGTDLPEILASVKGLSGGSILTTRSNSAAAAFENLTAGLALSSSGQLSTARTYLQHAIDVVVQISSDRSGTQKVMEIIDTNGRQEVLFSSVSNEIVEASAPAWFEQAIRDGYEINSELFT